MLNLWSPSLLTQNQTSCAWTTSTAPLWKPPSSYDPTSLWRGTDIPLHLSTVDSTPHVVKALIDSGATRMSLTLNLWGLKNIWTHQLPRAISSLQCRCDPQRSQTYHQVVDLDFPVWGQLWMGDIPCHQHQPKIWFILAYVAHEHNPKNRLVHGRYLNDKTPSIMQTKIHRTQRSAEPCIGW